MKIRGCGDGRDGMEEVESKRWRGNEKEGCNPRCPKDAYKCLVYFISARGSGPCETAGWKVATPSPLV